MRTKAGKRVVNVVTLGCSKNVVDSESLMKQLDANGLQVIYNSNSSKTDTVIINTCGFIKDAKEESIDTILQFVKAKEMGKLHEVYVMGCLSERYKSDLEKEIGNVDKYFGSNSLQEIIETLGYNYKENLVGERLTTTPGHYAYLKISEGCDRQCSFCAIPLMRGKHKSKTIEALENEAKILAGNGVKELILIAQDLTYFGIDLYQRQKLGELLIRLSDIKGIEWIRLHYAYPSGFPREVLQIMRERNNICNYLDIPFQHISDPVLKKMRRGVTSKQTYQLINDFRNHLPDLTLRTTLMVGHPGEGEKEFEELQQFVEKVRFDRLGVFTYSEEEDTYGARNFKDIVSEQVKQSRAESIMEQQAGISDTLNRNKIGSIQRVIIDRKEGEFYIGRTEGDSPEVDNEVLIRSVKKLYRGNFYQAQIINTEAYDLLAEII
jgi:ribosomal protein S12 methylthiotransferase